MDDAEQVMEVTGQHNRKSPVVFDPAEDVEDIEIHVPHSEIENARWGERRLVFSQSAESEKGGKREWTHYVQVSKEMPRRFRMATIHAHPESHKPQYFTMEYTDYGQFKQNDPEMVTRLPSEVYQAMLGMSVALREVKLMTLEALEKGEFKQAQEKPVNARMEWNPAPGIYAITIAGEAGIESQWEMGISLSQDKPAHYRAFARDVESGKEVGLYTHPNGKFQPSQPGIKNMLPEEVYSGLVGLSMGCTTAREMTLEYRKKGEITHNPLEKNKNRDTVSRRWQKRVDAEGKSEGRMDARGL